MAFVETKLVVVTPLIVKHHYAHKVPARVTLCVADVDNGPPRVVQACAIFSPPGGRWEEPLWELTRLARTPDYDVPLTKLLSFALGRIRASKSTDLLISMSDAQEDHHGGIYQSASWLYSGMRGTRLDGYNIDGQFVAARTVFHQHKTTSYPELVKLLPNSVIDPHYDDGKHLYWKPLSKSGLQKGVRIGLVSVAYPKPMMATGINKTTTGHQGKGMIAINAAKRENDPTQQARTKSVFDKGDAI